MVRRTRRKVSNRKVSNRKGSRRKVSNRKGSRRKYYRKRTNRKLKMRGGMEEEEEPLIALPQRPSGTRYHHRDDDDPETVDPPFTPRGRHFPGRERVERRQEELGVYASQVLTDDEYDDTIRKKVNVSAAIDELVAEFAPGNIANRAASQGYYHEPGTIVPTDTVMKKEHYTRYITELKKLLWTIRDMDKYPEISHDEEHESWADIRRQLNHLIEGAKRNHENADVDDDNPDSQEMDRDILAEMEPPDVDIGEEARLAAEQEIQDASQVALPEAGEGGL